MPRSSEPMLDTGDRFPSLEGVDLEGATVGITDLTANRWSVVLFYRGHW